MKLFKKEHYEKKFGKSKEQALEERIAKLRTSLDYIARRRHSSCVNEKDCTCVFDEAALALRRDDEAAKS